MCNKIQYVAGLTAVIGGKFPEVQVFEGEVDKRGQFAGSDPTLGESFQI